MKRAVRNLDGYRITFSGHKSSEKPSVQFSGCGSPSAPYWSGCQYMKPCPNTQSGAVWYLSPV